ncbi:MAG: hypothetical protein PHV74_01695 [Dehalococcoidia bacterium]|nr:hypothetical protein [Dehalococcoidia bacterium]
MYVDTLPRELLPLPNWVAWRFDPPPEVGGKPRKVPINPNTGMPASTIDPATWSTFAGANERAEQDRLNGVGFVFTNSGFTGIDLDHCVSDGIIEPWVERIIQDFNSYAELSQSSTGVHIIVQGKLPPGARRKGNIEAYDSGRYFVITGEHLEGTPVTIEPRQPELAAFHAKHLGSNGHGEVTPAAATVTITMDDQEIVRRMLSSSSGAKIKALMDGDTAAYGGDDSAADMALCAHLAFWCQKDPGQMDRLFRSSGLMRAKWDEKRGAATYGQLTIARAVEGCRQIYTPGNHSSNAKETSEIKNIPQPSRAKNPWEYEIAGGELCLVRKARDGGEYLQPLCSFDPKIEEEIMRDDGLNTVREYIISATMDGANLPAGRVSEADLQSGAWPRKLWGAQANVYPGSTTSQHIRSYLQSGRRGTTAKPIFTHTGWRQIGKRNVFLSASGATGLEGIQVELSDRLARYSLPTDFTRISACESMKTSLKFIEPGFGQPGVMVPLWAAMYGCPLMEFMEPSFTLFLCGQSGALKSTLEALALNHFGEFTYLNLPSSWEDTANRLQYNCFVLKDLPLVIDDWAPAATVAAQREQEQKMAAILRSQGNRQGRGRLAADASPKDTYVPRGLVITSGEQLPRGESNAARTFTLGLQRGQVNMEMLTEAQQTAHMYRYAMAQYVVWITSHWEYLAKYVPDLFFQVRDSAQKAGLHLRLPGTLGWLYASLDVALSFAQEAGVLSDSQKSEVLNANWEMLFQLAQEQGERVNSRRAGVVFLGALQALLSQSKLVLISKKFADLTEICGALGEPEPRTLKAHETFVGWEDAEYLYLIPAVTYERVYSFLMAAGQAITSNPDSVWSDLHAGGYSECNPGRDTFVAKVGTGEKAISKRVIKLKKKVLADMEGACPDQTEGAISENW